MVYLINFHIANNIPTPIKINIDNITFCFNSLDAYSPKRYALVGIDNTNKNISVAFKSLFIL